MLLCNDERIKPLIFLRFQNHLIMVSIFSEFYKFFSTYFQANSMEKKNKNFLIRISTLLKTNKNNCFKSHGFIKSYLKPQFQKEPSGQVKKLGL